MIELSELAISFSWPLLLAGYLHSVVFIQAWLFDVECDLSLLDIVVARISFHPCLFDFLPV